MIALRHKWLSGLFALFAAVYVAFLLLTPPDKAALAKYHITAAQAIGLSLTIVIPYLVIWFISLVGYLRLYEYTAAIRHSPDGEAFTTISRGLLLLTLWLPMSAALSAIVVYYYHMHPASTANLVRLNNYANLAILFPSLWLINQGAQQLLTMVKRPFMRLPQRVLLTYLSFAACYVFLTFQDPARHAATELVAVGTYYLPDWVTLLTIVIPRLIMWFLGIQAVYYIHLYAKKVKGNLYKAALHNLTRGLAWVIAITIILRCFQSLSSQLAHLNLAVLLLMVYALLVIISIGYVLIAKGSQKLQRFEEV